MPKAKSPYRTFPLLPILCGFVVFISTVIVAITSILQPNTLTFIGNITVINHGQFQTPVIITTLNNQLLAMEVVGPKSGELVKYNGSYLTFDGRLTGVSGTYGLQFEVISYRSTPVR